jgi:GT2 family glycosyltransferase
MEGTIASRMDQFLVSIIIVNYNTKELTKNCIDSLIKHILTTPIEIIVVDNHSNDDSVNYLRQEFSNINIITNNQNQGFGYANNVGVQKANGKYVLLLNSDTILLNDIIKSFVNVFEKNKHLKIGVLGSLLLSDKLEIIHSFGGFPYLLKKCLRRSVHDKSCQVTEDAFVPAVDVVVGADMFMEKATYLRFNGFDQNIFLYEEEMELQYRMRREGFSSLIIKDKGIIHLKGMSSSQYFQRKCSLISSCYIMKKHLPRSLYILYRIICVVYAVIFFKNPRISLQEKLSYLKVALVLNDAK